MTFSKKHFILTFLIGMNSFLSFSEEPTTSSDKPLEQFSLLETPCEVDPQSQKEKREVTNKEKSNPSLQGTDQGCKVGLRYCSQAIPDILDKISIVSNTPSAGNSKVTFGATMRDISRTLFNNCGDQKKNSKYGFMDMKIAGYYAGKSIHFESPKRTPANGCFNSTRYGFGLPEVAVCNPVELDHLKVPACMLLQSVNVQPQGGVVDFIHGQKESAFLRGAWVQALKCYKKQVMDEIEEGGGVRLTSGWTTAAARDIASLYKKDQDVSSSVTEAVLEEVMKSELTPDKQGSFLQNNFCHNVSVSSQSQHVKVPDLCSKDYELESGQSKDDELFKNLTKHRLSACYLANARSATETAFIDLATTEIIARAYNHYNTVFSGFGKYTIFKLAMKEQVVSPCVDAQKSCRSLLPNAGAAKKCALSRFDGCYKQKMPLFFNAFIAMNFPDNGKCILGGGLGGLMSWAK